MNYTFRDFGNISVSVAPAPVNHYHQIDRSTGNTMLFTIVDADADIPTKPARIVFSRSSGCLFLNRAYSLPAVRV